MQTQVIEPGFMSQLRVDHINRKDIVVPLNSIYVDRDATLNVSGQAYRFNDWSERQFANHLNIPYAYYARIKAEEPKLVSMMANHSFSQLIGASNKSASMIRVNDESIRAWVSPSFLTVSTYEIMSRLLPVLLELGYRVERADTSERRFYLRVTHDLMKQEVAKGDVISYGLSFSTSDVGCGTIDVSSYMTRLLCLNGMKGDNLFKRRHVGSTKNEDNSVRQLYASDTVTMENELVVKKLLDVTSELGKGEQFDKEIERMRIAAGVPVTKVIDTVKNACDRFKVNDADLEQKILESFIGGNQNAGHTLWGLSNSFTAVAKDLGADRRDEFESIGHKILALPELVH